MTWTKNIPKIFVNASVREMYAVLISFQLEFMYGIILGYSSYLVRQLLEEREENFEITKDNVTIIGTSGVSLRVVGAIISTFACDIVGRRNSLRISFLCFIIGWMAIALSFNLTMLIVARMFISLFSGTASCSVTYVTEVTTDRTRSTYLSLFPMLINIGTEFAYVITYAFGWKLAAIVTAAYSAATLLLLCTIPESPYWYAMHGQLINAEQSVKWFEPSDGGKAATLLAGIENSIKTKPTVRNKLRVMRNATVLKRLGVVTVSIVFLQFTGYQTLNSYSVQFFESLHSPWNSELLGIVYGLIVFLCNIVLTILVGRVKRRYMVITANTGMAVTAFVVLICRQLYATDDADHGRTTTTTYSISSITTVGVFVYCIFLYTGSGTALWITVSELFPTVLRGTLYALYDILVISLSVAVTYLLPYLIYYHVNTLLITALISCGCIGIVATFFLPETSNLNIIKLEQVSN